MRLQPTGLLRDPGRRNGLSAGLQAVVAAAAVFLVYRMVIAEVGMEVFGLWSVLLAGASVARMADVSGGSGLSRFVAGRRARGEASEAVGFVHTTVLATLGLTGAGSLLVLLFSTPLIGLFAPEGLAEGIAALLPLVLLVSVLLPSLSATLCSGIDGTQRADLRALLMGGSYAVLLGGAALTVGRMGIYGFVAALALQHAFIAAGAWLLLRRLLPGLGWLPSQWSQAAFRESFGFGLKVQANSFAGMLSDPAARVLIAWWGGMAASGVYELAMRLMLQLRAPFVAAMQPLVPAVAALGPDRPEAAELILAAMRRILPVAVLFVAIAVGAAPLYSRLMLGRTDPFLVLDIALLAAGYGANLVSVPLFFGALALGTMRWNIAAQFVLAGCILAFGTLGGWLGGGSGVVAGQVLGLLAAAATIMLGNARALGLRRGLKRDFPLLIIVALTIAAFAAIGVASVRWISG